MSTVASIHDDWVIPVDVAAVAVAVAVVAFALVMTVFH